MRPIDIKPGLEVWVLDRARVRSGAGPFKAVVSADIVKTNGSPSSFRVSGTRGWYTPSEAFATQPEAQLAWVERAESETRKEQARFNKIATRLAMAWQGASA
jgi:hypothetical protein